MSQNDPIPPTCAAFAPLLPLVGRDLLAEAEAVRLRAHLAGCAHCRAELAIYDEVETALRRSFAPRLGASPPFTREELMQTLDHDTDQPIDHPTPSAPLPAPAAPPRRSRRLLAVIPALAAILAIVVIAATLFAARGHKTPGTGSPNTATPQRGSQTWLTSVSMVSQTEGWAVGNKPRSTTNPDPTTGAADENAVEPVILHYQNGRWSLAQLPPDINPYNLDMTLYGISMVSAAEGWAIGSTLLPAYPHTIVDGITFGVLLHYTGGRWIMVNLPGKQNYPPTAFASIAMRSASDGWAVGNGVFHYDGAAWTEVHDLAFASLALQTVAVAPDGEVWIAGIDTSKPGFDGDDLAVILHYNGKTWARQQTKLANDRIFGLASVSSSEGWAVGYTPNGTGPHPSGPQKALIAQYHNGVWQEQSTVAGPSSDTFFHLSAVAMTSTSEGWAVGNEGTILHYYNGAWSQAHSPTIQTLLSIAMVSPNEGWAVGAQGTILHYLNGVWNVYQA